MRSSETNGGQNKWQSKEKALREEQVRLHDQRTCGIQTLEQLVSTIEAAVLPADNKQEFESLCSHLSEQTEQLANDVKKLRNRIEV